MIWKYVLKPELYDLTTDIGEQTDLASVHPELAKRLEQHGREAVEALKPHRSVTDN